MLGVSLGILAIGAERRLVGKMLTRPIMSRLITVGPIRRSIQDSYVCWCIPLRVKASAWWNLLISNLVDVTASITFEQTKRTIPTVWINPNVADSARVDLQIGSEFEIGLTEEIGGTLRPYGEMTGMGIIGNSDIVLELRTGSILVGRWKFLNAITESRMKQTTPTRLPISSEKRPAN